MMVVLNKAYTYVYEKPRNFGRYVATYMYVHSTNKTVIQKLLLKGHT